MVAHDGFTLRDLVSFDERHNEANLEGNRDGHGHNLGWNCGIEGPTSDAGVNRLRARLQRALLATLLLAQGTPMLAAGDELGHTQGGNNNPYCQDNPTTWIDWAQADADLLAFTRRVLALRRHAQPFRDAWYHGIADRHGLHDLAWLSSDGSLLVGDAWNLSGDRMLGCLIGHPAKAGAPLLLLFNPDPIDRPFQLPAGVWRGVLDTSDAVGRSAWHGQGEVPVDVPARGMLMLAAAGAKLGVDLD